MFVILAESALCINKMIQMLLGRRKCDVGKPDFESILFLVILVLTFTVFILADVWLFYFFKTHWIYIGHIDHS